MTFRHSMIAALALAAACNGNGDKDGSDSDDTDGTNDTSDTSDTGTSGGSVTCENNICTATGTITEDQNWTKDNEYVLSGGVFIGDDSAKTTLTIEAGTTIYGQDKSFLLIQRGSEIVAEGTESAPIVFTSSKDEGSRGPLDWGGLVINGKAPTNTCSDADGGVPGEAGTGFYCGDSPTDSSGTLKYVRVEFAGNKVDDQNELNGIAFQGVGSGTTIEHIHVHRCDDDGVEFFGGTANAKWVLVTGVGDDGFDWTDGWSGSVQWLAVQNFGTTEGNGIEADNNGDDNDAEPRSAPMLKNVTLWGGDVSAGTLNQGQGMLLRRGTAANIDKAIIGNWGKNCVDLDDLATHENGWEADTDGGGDYSGELTITNSLLDCGDATDVFASDDMMVPFSDEDWFLDGSDNDDDADTTLTAGTDATGLVPADASASPLANSSDVLTGGFFTDTTYIGAFGDTNWAAWTEFAEN